VPTECCVYVPNASTGIDVVLHNLNYKPGDVIIGFATTYDSVEYTTQYLTEMTSAEYKKIQYTYPISDQAICDAFEDAVKKLVRLGKKPRIAVFDTITSLPAFRMPFERLTEICRSQGVLSLIDGAHGVGMLPLQLRQLDADFFVSNCHKWLYTPRGCGVMYVPARNQHLLKVTLPTGYGFLPFPREEDDRRRVPNNFLANFADLGTRDETPYLCVSAALEWRKKLAWEGKRGDEAVMAYLYHLADQGGSTMAATLGTEVLAQGQSSMTNVRLPLSKDLLAEGVGSKPSEIGKWIMKEMMLKHDTAVNITWYAGALWVRLSAQVYLTLEDFDTAAVNLKAICEAASGQTWTSGS
jgi:hercynylcysteine S-oxide lyase